MKSRSSRKLQIKSDLQGELKKIETPTKTGHIKDKDSTKIGSPSVLMTRYYRTELDEREFLKQIDAELMRKGWKYYEQEDQRAFMTFRYCKDEYKINLYQEKRGLFSDADYFRLSISWNFEATFEWNAGNYLSQGCRKAS